jgi:segregation and condensation protein A
MEALIHFKLDQFEGPIDLLLQLIEKQKLDISEISLSRVTEQYLDFIEVLENEKDAEDIAGFLMVATRLLLLKSKTLLPNMLPDEEDGPSLEDQLKIYRVFIEKSEHINKLWQKKERSFSRKGDKILRRGESNPENLSLAEVEKFMLKLIQKLEPPKPIPISRVQKTISLKERISYLRSILKRKSKMKFHEMFASKKEKADIVITFLAILELAKRQTVYIDQDVVFGEIIIKNK